MSVAQTPECPVGPLRSLRDGGTNYLCDRPAGHAGKCEAASSPDDAAHGGTVRWT